MLPAILENTTIVDLQKLVTNCVTESIKLDLKRDNYRINNANADDKKKQCKELLKDTTAFANSQGGDIIIGIEEDNGAASTLIGFQVADADNLKRQMIDIIRNGTQPKIAFTIHSVELSRDRHVFIIRIRQSNHGPHKVAYQGEPGTYWCRNSGGAHEMTAQEVGELARQSQSLRDKIEGIRKERVEAIARNETPVDLLTPQRMVFHFIPEMAFSGFEIKQQELVYFAQWMPMLHDVGGWSHDYNSDGMVTFDRDPGIPTSGYVQLYRNGIIESVADDVTWFHPADTQKQTRWFSHNFIPTVPARIKNYFVLYGHLEVPPPVWFFMSFIGLDGSRVWSKDFLRSVGKPIREKVLLTPGVEIADYEVEIESLFKPGVDKLWNAGGYSHCTAFNW
jgi:hypothetical protein